MVRIPGDAGTAAPSIETVSPSYASVRGSGRLPKSSRGNRRPASWPSTCHQGSLLRTPVVNVSFPYRIGLEKYVPSTGRERPSTLAFSGNMGAKPTILLCQKMPQSPPDPTPSERRHRSPFQAHAADFHIQGVWASVDQPDWRHSCAAPGAQCLRYRWPAIMDVATATPSACKTARACAAVACETLEEFGCNMKVRISGSRHGTGSFRRSADTESSPWPALGHRAVGTRLQPPD